MTVHQQLTFREDLPDRWSSDHDERLALHLLHGFGDFDGSKIVSDRQLNYREIGAPGELKGGLVFDAFVMRRQLCFDCCK